MKRSKLNAWLAFAVLVAVIILALSGCANYSLKNNTSTTTIQPDGSQVVEQKTCELSISSFREVKAADVKVSTKCALTGGDESLGANEKLIELMTTVIKKVP